MDCLNHWQKTAILNVNFVKKAQVLYSDVLNGIVRKRLTCSVYSNKEKAI
jgi:hypothetical protein